MEAADGQAYVLEGALSVPLAESSGELQSRVSTVSVSADLVVFY